MTRKSRLLAGTAESAAIARGTGSKAGRVPNPEPTSYLPRAKAAELLGCSVRHLERKAQDGSGPPFLMHGNRAVYPADQLDAWARSQLRCSTSEPGKADAGAGAAA